MPCSSTFYQHRNAAEPRGVRSFGLLGMAMGVGFAVGPMLGGLLGLVSPKATAISAALIMATTAILAAASLPETHLSPSVRDKGYPGHERHRCGMSAVLKHTRVLGEAPVLMFGLPFLLAGVAAGPYSIWYLFAERRFGWDSWQNGLFLAGYGLATVLGQGFLLPALNSRLLSEQSVVIVALCTNAGLFLVYGALRAAQAHWLYSLLPACTLGTLSEPVLRHVFTQVVPEGDQGALQGGAAHQRFIGVL